MLKFQLKNAENAKMLFNKQGGLNCYQVIYYAKIGFTYTFNKNSLQCQRHSKT